MRVSIRQRFYLNAGIAVAGIVATAALALSSLDAVMQHSSFQRTQASVDIAASVVRDFQKDEADGRLSRAEAQARARRRLSSIRYEGDNYVFIVGEGGRMVMHPIKPALDGAPLDTVKDVKGDAFFTRLYAGARDHGSATARYVWPKPGGQVSVPKLAYALYVPKWDWAVGSGVYLDDVTAELIHTGSQLALLALLIVVVVLVLTLRSSGALNMIIKLSTVEMEALGRGELGQKISWADRTDEVGRVAKSLTALQAALRDRVRLEAEASHHRDEIETRLRQSEEAHREAARHQTETLTALRSGLSDLAAGRLSSRLEHAFSEAYEPLRGDFNSAMDKLNETMRTVATNATAIRSGSGEISSASDDLSRRSEQQAASLEETASALDEITATVRRTAEVTVEARKVVDTARSHADRSGEVVRSTVSAMGAIEQSSREISQIIGVIDEIAFQTNLLALNAGVEAARAGDSGRGFAVVASEVRALAQRSAAAAKEIKALIAASSSQVNAGVELVAQTGQSLESIMTQVNHLNTVVVEIAASAAEQASALAQVNTAVNQMDHVTQQNVAMVEQSTAASHALRGEADTLSELIGGFELGTPVQAVASRTSAASAAPKRRIAAAAPAAPVPARRTSSASGAARKPAPQSAEDSWEEF